MTGVPAEERSDAVGRERNPSNQYQNQYLSPLWATYPKSPVLSPLRGLVFVWPHTRGYASLRALAIVLPPLRGLVFVWPRTRGYASLRALAIVLPPLRGLSLPTTRPKLSFRDGGFSPRGPVGVLAGQLVGRWGDSNPGLAGIAHRGCRSRLRLHRHRLCLTAVCICHLDSGTPALKRHPGMTVRFEPVQPISVNPFV